MQISHSEALRSFEINVIGHMLTFKHFVPLVGKEENKEDDKGLLPGGRSVLASISARVGSIQDNELGGYVSPPSTIPASDRFKLDGIRTEPQKQH
jgi:hypothetical protein